MDAVCFALGHGIGDFVGNLVLLLLDRLNQRALQTQAVVTGIDDQTRCTLVLGQHIGVVIKAQQHNLLGSLGLLGLPFMHSVPIAEAQIIVLALRAVDQNKADFGVLGQLHATIRLGRRRGLTLQIKHGGSQQRRAHKLIQDIVQIFGAVFLFEDRNRLLELRVKLRCLGHFFLILFGHGFVPHFNFIALMASRR